MTVRELIKELEQYNEDHDVVIFDEDSTHFCDIVRLDYDMDHYPVITIKTYTSRCVNPHK